MVGAIGQGCANFENHFQPVPQVTHNANGDDSLAAVGNRPQLAENGGLLGGEGSANAAAEIAPGSPQTAPGDTSPAPAVGEDFHTILGASLDGVGLPGLPAGGGLGGTLDAERLGDNAGQLPPADRAGVAGAAGVGGGQVLSQPEPLSTHSDAADLQQAAADVAQTECSAWPKLSAQPVAQVTDLTRYKEKLTVEPFNRSKWKRSRVRKGWLIRRYPGYNIAETEYGISYLWVLSRKPDRTSADNSAFPLAGYFNWKSLEQSGLLAKEKQIGNRKSYAG